MSALHFSEVILHGHALDQASEGLSEKDPVGQLAGDGILLESLPHYLYLHVNI